MLLTYIARVVIIGASGAKRKAGAAGVPAAKKAKPPGTSKEVKAAQAKTQEADPEVSGGCL
jgi:hypothetical protein